MNRKDFLSHTMMAGIGVTAFSSLALARDQQTSLEPFTIEPTLPLSAGPRMADIRTIVSSARTGGQFSNVEVAIGPKRMGPSPHVHKDLDELMLRAYRK
jgi:hypothetical protein